MHNLARSASQPPLLVAPSQMDFTQPVLFHHFDQLLKLVEIKRSVSGRRGFNHTFPFCRFRGSPARGPFHEITPPSSRGTQVSTSQPSRVTSTSSSIRTPPIPGRYIPGSTVTTIPGFSTSVEIGLRRGPS